MPRPDRDAIIDTCWPSTNSPTEDDVISAAIAVRELLYYLNCATTPDSLREVTTIHTVTTNVGSAIAHSGPILDQLARSATRLSRSGALTEDRLVTDPSWTASHAAGQLAAARDTLGTLYDHLASAANELSHLHKPHDGDTAE